MSELKQLFQQILDRSGCLERSELDLQGQQAKVTLMLYPEEKGFDRDPDWRRLCLKGLTQIQIWVPATDIPTEFPASAQPTSGFLQFITAMFREQWLDQPEFFGFDIQHNEPATWSWKAGESQATESLSLYMESPLSDSLWQIRYDFQELLIETPLETEQSLKDFVNGWKFLADS